MLRPCTRIFFVRNSQANPKCFAQVRNAPAGSSSPPHSPLTLSIPGARTPAAICNFGSHWRCDSHSAPATVTIQTYATGSWSGKELGKALRSDAYSVRRSDQEGGRRPASAKMPRLRLRPLHHKNIKRPGQCPTSFRDACRIQTCDLLIRSQMLYSAELRRHCLTGGPVCYSAAAAVSSFATVRLASLMRAFLPARSRR